MCSAAANQSLPDDYANSRSNHGGETVEDQINCQHKHPRGGGSWSGPNGRTIKVTPIPQQKKNGEADDWAQKDSGERMSMKNDAYNQRGDEEHRKVCEECLHVVRGRLSVSRTLKLSDERAWRGACCSEHDP